MFFVSSAGRAKETAKRTLEKFGKEAKIFDWLHEEYLFPYTTKNFGDGNIQWYFCVDEYAKKFKELDEDKSWYNDVLMKTTEIKKAMDIENEKIDNFFCR